MKSPRRTPGTGHSASLWPVLLLLTIAVLIPTACLLWFMTRAMANERLAVRQRLTDSYRQQLDRVAEELSASWQDRLETLDAIPRERPLPQQFQAIVTSGVADSVVFIGTDKLVHYPQPYPPTTQSTSDAETFLRTQQDRLRGLLDTGRPDEAAQTLTPLLEKPELRAVCDPHGRPVLADLMLLVVSGTHDHPSPARTRILNELSDWLARYEPPSIPPAQKLFLMGQLDLITSERHDWPTRAGLTLALRYGEHLGDAPIPPSPANQLAMSPVSGIWQLAQPENHALLLFTDSHLAGQLTQRAREAVVLADLRVAVGPIPADNAGQTAYLARELAPMLPGWQVRIDLVGDNPFAQAASRQITVYFWTAVLVIAAIIALAAILAGYLSRQIHLTRLKNNLIATVSHELKTPLASTRVLVDTLLSREHPDPARTREYLELIATENARLSRLIDNFLTFSRMERNKRSFAFEPIDTQAMVAEAVEAVTDRYRQAGLNLELDLPANPPALLGDRDGLITVLVNLLDNALKYSPVNADTPDGPRRRIDLRAVCERDRLRFEVEDRGQGIPRRHLRRIFDRFHQVDRSLSRQTGGCGLGLSIVKFIVDAHGGTIDVRSQPGAGSCFIITLPTVNNPAHPAGPDARRADARGDAS